MHCWLLTAWCLCRRQVMRLTKTYEEFCDLDRRLRRVALTLVGLKLPAMPSRWGLQQPGGGDGLRTALQHYLWVAVTNAPLQDAAVLQAFLSDGPWPVEIDEEYQVGLLAAVLAVLHRPPLACKQPLQAEWLDEFVEKALSTMSHNADSEVAQRGWLTILGVMSSYEGTKPCLLSMGAIGCILDALHVHFASGRVQAVGCWTLCVISRGLDSAANPLPNGAGVMEGCLLALTAYPYDIDVCTGGCATVWAMAYKNPEVQAPHHMDYPPQRWP